MSSESTFVANVKTRKGTIITVRGDTYDTFKSNITLAVTGEIGNVVGALEDSIVGSEPMSESDVASSLGANVVSITTNTPAPSCKHGTRKHKAGQGGKGPWQAWMCPSAKGTPDQCEPIWIKRGEAGWK